MTFGDIPVISITTPDQTGAEQTINIKADYTVTDERDRDIVVPNEYNNVSFSLQNYDTILRNN